MASFSSLGVGSNLDLSTLLTQLQTAESQPLVLLQQRQVSYTSKLSAYGTLQSSLSTLQTAAKKLSDPALFQGVKAVSSAADVLTASAAGTATAGTYAVNVTQLAQPQSLVAAGQASTTTAIGSGTITIDFGAITGGTLDPATGTYTGAGFTPDATRTAVPITINGSNNTLAGIRDAINAAKAGVSASIVNDGSGTPNRLVLTSLQSGETSSMRVSVAGDAALQGLLNNDPAGTQNLRQTVAAQNAELTVNGIAVTSASNTVKEAIQGTTLTLLKTGASSLSTQADTAAVETAINDFVKAYNSLQATARTLTTYDQDSKTGAALVGDSTLRNLQTSIRQALTTPQAGGANDMKVLSEIGVAFQKDGTMAVDSAKLKSALAGNLAGVSGLFASATGSTAGYGKQLSALVDNLTSTGGALKVASDGMTASLKQLDQQYTDMQMRVEAKVERYRAQFTQLDLLMSQMNSTSNYLTQQFASMQNSSSK
ncbi:flagellar filament capping protein FliD [Variovorax paradoxus]|jgi:flagellar hook-associated protein 2|uniref:flagellar filament capping protein FliD n=1 Tax=Variovorax paradoxus TaxID=34073 RepID=UPI0029C76588|nr:flagellar filament capping protein FliD [Variovorax paradoxus]WPH19568.1 flagellar filament capping protein FliD [Variovorax paradoxus]